MNSLFAIDRDRVLTRVWKARALPSFEKINLEPKDKEKQNYAKTETIGAAYGDDSNLCRSHSRR